ncbi:hypothetical protein BDQ17DRAFT_1376229 [Cyathus striatus]|nr:hypothetical protein BDQ17DRAFT_1376229 [Cyathus striatus]
MPVAANVVIAIVTLIIIGLFITLIVCMKCYRGHSRTAAPDFIFDSEQMQGPPTIIETHYNPSSGRVDVYSAKSPSFSSSSSSLERKSSVPERGKSPALPTRGKSPALPPRAKSPFYSHNQVQNGVPPVLHPGPMTMRQNRLSLPASFLGMPQPMTAPANHTAFAFNVTGETRPPSYEGQGQGDTTTYPQPPQTAFVTTQFERPPMHPSLRRTGRYVN